ncbi:MAG: glycosyltransferase family 39 protein [Leptospiraceae bacterium]|nr:glycosyltransferase family 39 protein [Leptospiraceae bacterium]MCP5484525.1 glycosyltransferase family 39 protein [Spirochaetales bacterium]
MAPDASRSPAKIARTTHGTGGAGGPPWRPYLLGLTLAALGLLLLLPGIGGLDLLRQGDEVMHIATIRESYASGEFLFPVLNGVPNYYKPPLLFWLGMATEALFGPELYGLRLAAVLSAIGTVLLLFVMLLENGARDVTASLVSLIYLTSLATMKFGRLMMMEQPMALCLLAVAFFFARFIRQQRNGPLLWAGLASATGFFFKGPVFQVYGGLLLTSWAVVLLTSHSFRRKPRVVLAQIVRAGLLFHAALVLPLLWILFLLTQTGPEGNLGELWLKYFFVMENLAKFREANQPEGRILLGWLVHALPFTPLLVLALIRALRLPVVSSRRLVGWLMIVWVLSLTLLHLLPNRKDAYYVVPMLPVLVVGIALTIPAFRAPWKALVRLQAGTGVLIALAFVFLAIVLKGPTLLIVGSLACLLIHGVLAFGQSSGTPVGALMRIAASGVCITIVLQFGMLPLLFRPLLPEELASQLGDHVCVVSHEPWDGYQYAMILPDHVLSHNVPGTPDRCEVDGSSVIAYRVPDYAPAAGYVETATWTVWSPDPGVGKIVQALDDGPDILVEHVRLFQPANQ